MPLDIFGNDGATAAAIDYAFRTLKEDSNYKQDVVGVNFRSNIAKGWAGQSFCGRHFNRDKSKFIPNTPEQLRKKF